MVCLRFHPPQHRYVSNIMQDIFEFFMMQDLLDFSRNLLVPSMRRSYNTRSWIWMIDNQTKPAGLLIMKHFLFRAIYNVLYLRKCYRIFLTQIGPVLKILWLLINRRTFLQYMYSYYYLVAASSLPRSDTCTIILNEWNMVISIKDSFIDVNDVMSIFIIIIVFMENRCSSIKGDSDSPVSMLN